ncbi:hypothetical protein Mapa_009287 [Marchantia paleacea]|nr:hypothetical protein Mapa_009287 [Marchantia paleacea]
MPDDILALRDGLPSRQQHHQKHPEAVNVALVRQSVREAVLRVQVAGSPLDERVHTPSHAALLVRLRGVLRHSEVRHLGVEFRVQQDVAGLDIAMEDRGIGLGVEVIDAPGRSQRDSEPGGEIERGGRVGREVVLDRAVHHELVDEKLVARDLVAAEALELDKVAVVHAREQLDLRLELLVGPRGQPRALDRHLGPVGQHAHVHLPEAPDPQNVRVAEPVRELLHLFPRPLLQPRGLHLRERPVLGQSLPPQRHLHLALPKHHQPQTD